MFAPFLAFQATSMRFLLFGEQNESKYINSTLHMDNRKIIQSKLYVKP
jgi:hypothetical protein